MMEDDRDSRPIRMLFVCVGNSCRSQMAEGLARAMGGGAVMASSAGIAPAGEVASKAVQAMVELGLDLSEHRPKMLDRELLDAADRVFIMGCDARLMCPADWLTGAVDWEIEDPMGKGLDKYREVRDIIRAILLKVLNGEGIEPLSLE